MTTRIWPKIAFVVAALGLQEWSQADEVRVRYHEPLQQLEMQVAAPLSTHSSITDEAGSLHGMRFNAFGKSFDVQLAPNRSLLQQLPASQRPTSLGVYRGTLSDVSNSWVRLVVDNGTPSGLIFDGQTMFAVERNEASGEAIVFRLEDIDVPPNMLSCSALGAPQSAANLLQKISGEIAPLVQSGPGATQNLDIALIADFEFTSDKGAGNAAAEMITRMNNVDGIFSAQLGVQLTVNRTDTFPSSNDPFTDESSAGGLLDELADYRFDNAEQRSNGLTHLFTGRNLDGSTVGIAYTSAVCSLRFGAGLTQGTNSVTVDSLIAAHEIGHNFGAPHDGTTGSNCESTTGNWLMSPSINGSDQFSACSITEMQSVVNQASCVTALPTTDVAVAVDDSPTTPLLGNLERVSFAVDSVGTDDASAVTVDVTLPSSVTLDSISATGGTCTSGAATASCDLGAISAGSGTIVSVIARMNEVGNAQFVADITATSDTNTSNDQVSVTLDVAPAVDLQVAAPAPSSITLNQSGTVRITVDNLASIEATDAQVTISPAAGLQIDTASWAPGSCAINSGDVTCDAATLAAQSSNTVTLGVTGTAEGSQSYSVSATANETDINTANNDASGSVNVGAVAATPSGGDDGGSGSVGALFVLLLLSLCLARRERFAIVPAAD